MKIQKKLLGFILIITPLVLIGMYMLSSSSGALSGSDFKRGNIISDALFYHGSTMNTSQIRTFLQAKRPSCDTNGTKSHSYYYNSSTGRVNNSKDNWVTTNRAKYGERYHNWRKANGLSGKGSRAPYTCLKSYDEVTSAKAANSYCKAYPGGHFTAARIIHEVGKACKISQKALIVLLQKEQSLVTDDWPWGIQYKTAMGYGCPDTGPNHSANCNSNYFGFFNQVYNAAKQFNRYKQEPGSFNFRANRTSNIQYHPNTGCGTRSVTIQNHATAGLYNYTPYTPNKAALNNLYGTGNGCSSYGNRNFWRMYNDWFGSTHKIVCTSSDSPSTSVFRNYNGSNHRHFFTRYECERDIITIHGSYKYEGVAFADATSGDPDTIPIYRVHDKRSGYRFWTKNKNEKDYLISKHGWGDDGIGFYSYNSNALDRKPVHRLYHPRLKVHLYTAAKSEINTAKSHGYKYEGVAFYAPN